jgi:hypothetical protein
MDWIQHYKKRVLSRLISVEPTRIKEKLLDSEYYLVSEKMDGFYTVLVATPKGVELFNKSGRKIEIPAIQSLKFNAACILVGELCVFENNRPRTHRELASALANPEKSDIRFAAFDVVEWNGKAVEGDALEKYQLLKGIAQHTLCFSIPQKQVVSRNEVEAFYLETVGQGAEGIIVKAANEMAYKIKPIIALDLVVLGFSEGIQEKAGMLRDLLLGVALENNRFQVVGSVGTGFSNEERSTFFKALSAEEVNSTYTEVSGAKTAFVMVKPQWVVEVTCLDILADNTQGPIKKTTLAFGPSGYDVVTLAPGVSLISCVFIRKRSDKTVGIDHAGVEQITDYLAPQTQEANAAPLQDSSVVLREVYTKESKKGIMVRKIFGMKTNKENTGLFAPFQVVFTDFSTGRAEPLDQEISGCANIAEMEKKAAALREEHIKTGWNKVK